MSDGTVVYGSYSQSELDAQYNAAATVPSLDPYFAAWTEASERTRATLAHERDVAYGEHARERMDLFPAPRAGAPLFVFMHGGYWRRLDASSFSFVAGPVVRAGGACAVLTYPLAPADSLDRIVAATRTAISWLLQNAASRLNARARGIVVGGHSAGGQLAGMLAATDWSVRGGPSDAIGAVFGLSGLYDLEPVRRSNVNDWLLLPDENAALRNSPLAHLPRAPVELMVAAGARETDEFKRQTRAYAAACRAAGLVARDEIVAGHNHYSIVSELAGDASAVTRSLLDLLARSSSA